MQSLVPPPFAYSIPQLVALTGIGRTTIYAELKAGRLKARKIGRRTIFLSEDVTAWLSVLPTTLTVRSDLRE
jgi:excisionase family DNA binding protein